MRMARWIIGDISDVVYKSNPILAQSSDNIRDS